MFQLTKIGQEWVFVTLPKIENAGCSEKSNCLERVYVAINRRSFVQRLAAIMGGAGIQKPSVVAAMVSRPTNQAEESKSAQAGKLHGYIRPGTIKVIHQNFDLVVVGGGLSGICAAISAARNGITVALVHERSMLGGNSASEVRLFPEDTCDWQAWIKEGGILDEITVEERVRNWEPFIEGLTNCHWDLVLYEWVKREKNLTLFLNTTLREVEMADESHILAVHAAQLGSETDFVLEAPLFVDATGIGVLGFRAGAEFRWGKELRSEFNEYLAPTTPDDGFMGNTLFFRARDTGSPVNFKVPEWAARFEDESDFPDRNHGFIEGGYWWIELAYPMNPIQDGEAIRDELLRQLLGVWDHIKNHCSAGDIRERALNYALEFVGFWPYKREARRLVGDVILTESDVRDPIPHDDDITYGPWGIDIHVAGGIMQRHINAVPEAHWDENWPHYGTIPYGIPLRACYSRNIRNLFSAGRPISTSYVAFASSRVLATGAIVGQGVGAAAALCRKHNCEPREIVKSHMSELQQLLLRQDSTIIGVENTDADDLARNARVTASSDAPLVFPDSDEFRTADYPLAQIFPVSTDHIDYVELMLESSADVPVTVNLGLSKAAHVWDFRSKSDVARVKATVLPRYRGPIRFDLNVRASANSLYFIHIDAAPKIGWALFQGSHDSVPSTIPVGSTPADLPGGTIWRPILAGKIGLGCAFSLKVSPEQRPYGPQNIVSGTSRPDLWTNIFISDPARSLPAWVELGLSGTKKINRIQLTFDTNLVHRARQPYFRYPECVKKYRIEAAGVSGWTTLVEADGNYFRQKVHDFPTVSTNRIRVTVLETNGSPSARIYEMRAYLINA